MYSVVLMMAMTQAPDVATFGHRNNSCCGCQGSSCYGGGCSGCYGGGCNGCHGGGGRAKKQRRSHGCHGGCSGCYGGGCSGYTASCGCCGSAMSCYGGGMGCYGGGGYMTAPMAPTAPPANVPPPKTGMLSGPATIVVSLPADATLKVDGAATKATTAVRTFATPTLDAGQSYHYTLTAEVVRDGKTLTTAQEITVRAGELTQVDLPATAFGLAVAAK